MSFDTTSESAYPLSPSSMRSWLSQEFAVFLEEIGGWGLGSIWQRPLGESYGSLCACRTVFNKCNEPLSVEIIKDTIEQSFCEQLIKSPLSQALTPTKIRLSPPSVINNVIQKFSESGSLPPNASIEPCHTYVVRVAPMFSEAQCLVLWHPQKLSAAQLEPLSQRKELMQCHLTHQCFQNWQASQIDFLEQVVYRTGHQLKTRLELLQLHTDLLNEQLNQRAASMKKVSEIELSINQLQEALRYMHQDLKRLTDCSPTAKIDGPCELLQLFQRTIEDLRPIWSQKKLFIQCEKVSCRVQVDTWKMTQVFQNLLNNAIAFSPTGGHIHCTWQRFQSEVLIQISDQGPGLVKKEINQIFSPYYSNRPGGTGLGLTIAKRIVLEHRGQIWAENLVTGGAQFSIVLPLVSPPRTAVRAPPS